METSSDNRVLKILPKINTILTFYRQANVRQYLINTTQVLTLVLRCKIMQHNNGGTVQYWQRIQFQILVNLLKWYIQIFLVKMVVEVLITLTQKINNCRQQTMMKILAIRMANHPLYPTLPPILSILLLLQQPSANPYRCTTSKALSTKVNKENPHPGSNVDHSGSKPPSH